MDISEHGTAACDNGVDDDGDGAVDSPSDLGCRDLSSPVENPACQDGVNNDGLSGIDFDGGASVNGGVPIDVADPQCSVPWTNWEAGAPSVGPCGIGPELALLLPLLSRLRRRRES